MKRNERVTDELLILYAQSGSAEAFERLVERWQQRLWRFAWRLTEDEEAAWDVLQETWLAISRRIHGLEDATAFPAWAYQIARHKSSDWVRRHQRRRRADEAYAVRVRQSDEEREAVRRRCGNLKEALADMSPHDRTILSLRYEEQFSTDEIAAILGIPPGTVKSRLYYARERLRHFLEENDDG
jgi:RNA polymerase sigma-70 factor (ECF subfamily)